jgi:hypothetical protein
MRHARFFRTLSLLFVVTVFFSTRCPAQAPVDPGQLPGRTSFYLLWRGTPTGEIRKNNSLYALWDDPEFSSARAALIESFLTQTQNPKNKPALNHEELAQYVTLLDNPFLIGYLRRPEPHAAAKSSVAKDAPTWKGMFFVYDRSGKEELLSKAVVQMRGLEKEIPKLTPLTVAGVSALKVERTSGITYWAEFGKYAVSANDQPVFEEIVSLLNGKPSSGLLSESATFQEAKPLLNGGLVEFFLSIPSVQEVALDFPSNSMAAIKPFLIAMKLDSIHSLAGHISLEGAKTHFQAAILGDTTPGGLFDIWADGQANPVSLAYLSPDTVYYSESQFNLLGLYDTLKRAFTQAGGNSSQAVNPLEAMAETRLGMPLPDALGLTTGEIAHLQTSPTLDENQKIYLLGIRNKPDALKLARTLMGDRITSERNEGNTTFLKISLRGGQSSAGVAQWNFYYLAMTPTLLFGSSKSETLRKYVGQAPANPDSALPQNMLAARGQYPEKLNGFSYCDFQKLDWAGLKAKWVAEADKSSHSAKTTNAANNNKKLTDWLSQVNPEVFSRHLHTVTGASWKDAKGVHFDEWLD